MRRLAWTSWAVILLLALAALGFRLANAPLFEAGVSDPLAILAEVLYWDILIPAAVPAFATLGAILVARRVANGFGWLALAFALFTVVQDLVWQYAARAVELVPGSLPGGLVAAWLNGLLSPLVTIVLGALLLLRFPTGRLPSARWRVVEWTGAVTALGTALYAAVGPQLAAGLETAVPNPLAVVVLAPAAALVDTVSVVCALGMVLAAVAAVALRFRGARGIARQQVRWLAYVAAVGVVAGAVAIVTAATLPQAATLAVLIGGVAIGSLTIGVPGAIGVAILRYRLYDIDRLVNRTVVYGLLSALLAGVYAGGVTVLQLLLDPVTGDSQLAVAASTLAVAALFRPARRQVQAVVDRRFHRRHVDVRATVEAFRSTLRDEVDLDALRSELLAATGYAVQPVRASIWLRDQEPSR